MRNLLCAVSFRTCRPYLSMSLTHTHRMHCMAWWTAQTTRLGSGERSIFTDESLFTFSSRWSTWRLTTLWETCIVERDRLGFCYSLGRYCSLYKPTVDCDCWLGIVGSLTAVRYRDKVLCPFVVPLVRQLILQHGYVQPHVDRVCLNFLANHSIV